MCMSLAPSRMSKTRLYAGEAMLDGKYVHVLAYKNKAENLTDEPNAMILPFPTRVQMTRANIVDTRSCPDFMDYYAEAVRPRPRTMSKGFSGDLYSNSIDVFESGSYTVVLANDASEIPGALSQVPVERRPKLNDAMFESFKTLYPGQPVALCCWSGSIDPEPLLWWYEPALPEIFFLPALDAHDGNPPHQGTVDVDHTLIFGSMIEPKGNKAHFDQLPQGVMKQLLPVYVQGVTFDQKMPNGDFFLPLRKVIEQSVGGVRRLAPTNLPAHPASHRPAFHRPTMSKAEQALFENKNPFDLLTE